MYYPPQIINQVIEANNIVEVIGEYVKLTKKGSTYFGLCPFHSEKTPSFSVTDNGDRHMYYCFGCHSGGSVLTFLMKYENLTYSEAIEQLAKRAGITLPKPDYSDYKERAAQAKLVEDMIKVNELTATYYSENLFSERGKNALEYFKGRGLSEETIKNYRLGYADKYSDDLYKKLKENDISDSIINDARLATIKEKGTYDFFWNRAMFPIIDERNRVTGFSGRVMGEGEPKYLNTPETLVFKKNSLIYGLNIAKRTKEDFFILCEGNMDVISLHQAGFTNAVASLGTALTIEHSRKLKKYKDKVFVSYDADTAGLNAALKAIKRLNDAGLTVKVIDLSPYKDPDELIKEKGAEEYSYRIKKAINSLIFEIFMLRRSYDMSDPDDVSKFQNETAKRISMIDDEFGRENYSQIMSKLFKIPYDLLKSKVKELALSTNKVEHVREVKSPEIRKKESDAMSGCSGIIFSYLIDNPEGYETVKNVISAEDFFGNDRVIAENLFGQLESKKINIAGILSDFEDIALQEETADKLHYDFSGMEKDEIEKAVTDSVVRIKQNSIDEALKDLIDTDKIVKLFKKKQDLNSLNLFGGN